MSSVYIRQRTVSTGQRFDVKYRRGGRYFPIEHGGTFKTREEAELRASAVRRELAERTRAELQESMEKKLAAIARQPVRGWIYYVRDEATKLIKIGWAREPDARLAALQTSAASNLTLLAIEPGTKTDERALHKRYSARRARGEWFREDAMLTSHVLAAAHEHARDLRRLSR